MGKILVPAASADAWQFFLAEKQWKTDYSAKTLAYCWQEADKGFPASVSAALRASSVPVLKTAEMLIGIPEVKVALPGGNRASQNDLFVLAKGDNQLVAITVEGKVDEPFGDGSVSEWLRDASEGKKERIGFICDTLGVATDAVGHVRYQLLHRTVSAVLLARQYTAKHALMLVHSFSASNKWFDEYSTFLSAFGAQAQVGQITPLGDRAGLSLYCGWVQGESEYRTR